MDAPVIYIAKIWGLCHKLYDQIGAKNSNYCKIDIFSQSENVSVYL